MKIVFQNQYFIALDKAPGQLAVPARSSEDPRPVLGLLLEQHLGKSIFPVHRLDAEVSGLILYALDKDSHREANRVFEERRVQKTYQAFSKGGDFAEAASGTWKAQILRGKKRAFESPVGKSAITDYEIKKKYGSIYEWRLRPKTGRSHQLRWELYRHESPIIGDDLYGSNETWSFGGIALRSLSLKFEEEFTNRWALPEHLLVEPWLLSPDQGLSQY